jgi:hypothetical protein
MHGINLQFSSAYAIKTRLCFLVLYKLDYRNLHLYTLCELLLHKLQKVQNTAVRSSLEYGQISSPPPPNDLYPFYPQSNTKFIEKSRLR